MKLLFATQNQHKFNEVLPLIPGAFTLVNLNEVDLKEELPENQTTLEGNALEKAWYVYKTFGMHCFADDTGLEVDALDGAPGVYSARYAGENKNAEHNMELVLSKLEGLSERKAQFRTIIASVINNKEYVFEGKVEGIILPSKQGEKGFGYDPIFQPYGYTQSFAQMSLHDKNKISHRARALKKFVEFLKTYK